MTRRQTFNPAIRPDSGEEGRGPVLFSLLFQPQYFLIFSLTMYGLIFENFSGYLKVRRF
jgi:hypothetical protein